MLLEAIREGDDGKLFQFLNTSEWLTAAEIFASSTEDTGPGKMGSLAFFTTEEKYVDIFKQ